jgi:hypothetical protein
MVLSRQIPYGSIDEPEPYPGRDSTIEIWGEISWVLDKLGPHDIHYALGVGGGLDTITGI